MQADRAIAQGTADIVGTVADNSGSVSTMAKVTVKNLDTNLTRNQQTDASGQYSFTLLPIGNYSVTVEAKGFKMFVNAFFVATGDRARVDSSLQVGDVTQTVEVTSQVAGVQTDSSTVGSLLTNPAELPTNGLPLHR